MEEPRLRNAPKLQFSEEEREVLDLLHEQYPAIPPFLVEMSLDYAKAHPAPGHLTSSECRKVKRGEMNITNCPETLRHLVDAQAVLAEINQKWSAVHAGTKGPASTVQIPKEIIEVKGAVKIFDGDDPDCPVYDDMGKQIGGKNHESFRSLPDIPDQATSAETLDEHKKYARQQEPTQITIEDGESLKI